MGDRKSAKKARTGKTEEHTGKNIVVQLFIFT